MTDNEKGNSDIDNSGKDNPDIYQISERSKPLETPPTPSNNSDIFAIKKENIDRLGSIIGMALSEGVFLCSAYRLDKRIARDEMGEIWKAADLQASRNVTLYLPPSEIRKDESASELVRQAAKRVEALDHPRIVPILDHFTDPEYGFFTVRKFVEGKTLDAYWHEYVRQYKKAAPLKVVKMLNDIAHALDYAHSVGAHGIDIVHGALCPKNIIVDQNGEVYVDNFALLPVRADNNVSATSQAHLAYLSPEILEGNPATAASDIYALAVIAYQLFAGRLPFSPGKDTPYSTPLPIPGVPSSVDAVILKALSKDPDDRYASCGAFMKALEAGVREKIKPSVVKPHPKPPKKKRGFRGFYWMLLLFGFFIGGAAACFVFDVEDVQTKHFPEWLIRLGIVTDLITVSDSITVSDGLPIEEQEETPTVTVEPMEETSESEVSQNDESPPTEEGENGMDGGDGNDEEQERRGVSPPVTPANDSTQREDSWR